MHRMATAALPEAWPPAALAAAISDEQEHQRAVVAEIARRPVGYLLYSRLAGEFELLQLVVDEGWRRRGVGRRLLAALCAEADGCDGTIMLELRASNRAALALYRTAGFTIVGRRPGYYRPATPGGARESALIMRYP
ncbi:MAG: GNAT family N-acetyltransferase [Zetaproteobacteria bacterium]|nr:MAG: GNAT family N-acetyltransferase [Zetaproteobacteria bacterium]